MARQPDVVSGVHGDAHQHQDEAQRAGRERPAHHIAGVALMQLWWLLATSAWQLAIFAVIFGVCYGGFVALYPALTVNYFGGRNASGIIGVLYTGGAIGSFVGPKLAGDAFDIFGSYAVPIAVGAVSALLAALLVISAPAPVHRKPVVLS